MDSGVAPASARKPVFDRYLLANISLWVLTYLLTTLRVVAMDDRPVLHIQVDMGIRRALVSAAAIAFCILIQKGLLASRHWPWGRRVLLAVGLCLAGGAFWGVANSIAFYAVNPVMPFKGDAMAFAISMAMNVTTLIWSFIAWCAIVFALDYDQEAREKTLRLVEAQALAAESQNQMLRYQINPHFLFNTLNALSSLILQKDFDRAERMVLSLSNFLRASLERPPAEKITVADEIAAQRQYLAIEQERFGDRLVLRETIEGLAREALAPGLILQPLVENAVKYGVARTQRPVTIEIIATERDGRLSITVQDDAVPDRGRDATDQPLRLGVGLQNVRKRLAALYGEAGVLTAGPRPGGGFAATVELPLERP